MLILYLLLSFGITNIIVRESITKPFRDLIDRFCDWCGYWFLHDLFNCETCTGFWVGMLIFWMLPLPYSPYLNVFISAFISSGWNKLINVILLKF